MQVKCTNILPYPSTLAREANLKMAIVFPGGVCSVSSLYCHLERKCFIIRKEKKRKEKKRKIKTQHREYLDERRSYASYDGLCIQNVYFMFMKDTY